MEEMVPTDRQDRDRTRRKRFWDVREIFTNSTDEGLG
jgi:hypothetical protein